MFEKVLGKRIRVVYGAKTAPGLEILVNDVELEPGKLAPGVPACGAGTKRRC